MWWSAKVSSFLDQVDLIRIRAEALMDCITISVTYCWVTNYLPKMWHENTYLLYQFLQIGNLGLASLGPLPQVLWLQLRWQLGLRSHRKTQLGKGLILSAQAAIIKYHRLADLNNRHLCLHSSEVWKSEIRVPVWYILVRAFFLCCRWLSSCCVFTWWKERMSKCFRIKALILSWGPHPHDLILNLITSQRPHLTY